MDISVEEDIAKAWGEGFKAGANRIPDATGSRSSLTAEWRVRPRDAQNERITKQDIRASVLLQLFEDVEHDIPFVEVVLYWTDWLQLKARIEQTFDCNSWYEDEVFLAIDTYARERRQSVEKKADASQVRTD